MGSSAAQKEMLMPTAPQLVHRYGRLPLAVMTAAALAAPILAHGVADRSPAGTALIRPAAATSYSPPKMRLVQANLRIGTPVRKFQADVRKVLSTHPDFVTYQEVAHRHDSVLAPGKYDVWRAGGDYQGETAVAWNAKKWHDIGHGDTMLSFKKGKPKGQNYYWGVRYANWVTLRNDSGRTLSVVSAHFAPDTKYTRDLTKPSARRLGRLTDKLGQRGPVLLGGDLNVSYHSSKYPRGILTDHRIVPTYDVLQRREVTSGKNVTLDYVMARGIARFGVSHQFTLGLNSDHNAVGADFSPMPDSLKPTNVHFGTGTVMSEPNGSTRDQRVIIRSAIKAIRSAKSGGAIHLASRSLDAPQVVSSLIDAHERGVHVQVLTGDRRKTVAEKRLTSVLGSGVKNKNWAVNRPGAFGNLPATTLLVSRTGGTPAFRLTSGVGLVPASAQGRQRATITAATSAYDPLFRRFFAAVGRKV